MKQRTQIEPLQVSIEKAAELLGYSRSTMYNLLARGEVKSVGQGKMRRVAVAELRRWQVANTSDV